MGPTRNLLIVHAPPRRSIEDWKAIGRKAALQAPDIDVRIADGNAPPPAAARWQASRPSLIFSPGPLLEYRPAGGTVLAGHNIDKLRQAARLEKIGVRVPRTFPLTPAFSPDPAIFGEYAVTKPGTLGRGHGISLVRVRDLARRYDELTYGGRLRLLAQPYIEHAEDGYPTEFRVLTLCGKVLYCAKNRWEEKRRPLAEIADSDGVIASNNKAMGGRVRNVWLDEEIIELGERASTAFPECGILGVDVIREPSTGDLYVLEVNPRGDVWHFSSGLAAATFTPEHVHDLYAQFNALDRAAALLIEKTRAAAS